MSRRAAFLDRDGVLNVRPRPHRYVESLSEFVWLESAAEGAARLAEAGYVLAVVSNQRGLARGLVSPGVLAEIEAEIQRQLAEFGARIATFRYCPHDLDAGCSCRKPAPGLLLAAAAELDLDLARSWMIGDSESDVLAGHAAGCAAALVGQPADARSMADPPELVGDSLWALSERLSGCSSPRSPSLRPARS